MKKYLGKIVLAALAACMGLAACGTDDDNTLLPPDHNGNATDSTQVENEFRPDSTELWSERDGLRIYGMMYRDARSSGKLPAVILSHSSSLTHKAMSGYAQAIARIGFAAVCFDNFLRMYVI